MIIGVCGFMNSGKSTVSQILCDKFGFVQTSFASPLKDAVATIFEWDRDMVEGATKESRAWREQVDPFWSDRLKKEITPRKVLQWMGTEAGRLVFGDDIWVASLEARVKKMKNVVVTDVRFLNEIDAIRNLMGGKVVRVMRGPDPDWWDTAANRPEGSLRLPEPYGHIHQSEFDWVGSGMDFTIDNNYGLDNLDLSVSGMLDSFGYRV